MCFAVMANIFLLEDDKILSKGISIALEKDKHTVTVVYGYMEALQKYQSQRYDLFLLDINLPDGNGFDLLEALHKEGKTNGVIILSARDSIDDKVKGLGLGADDYLTKPFYFSELNARIKAIIRRKQFKTNKIVNFLST